MHLAAVGLQHECRPQFCAVQDFLVELLSPGLHSLLSRRMPLVKEVGDNLWSNTTTKQAPKAEVKCRRRKTRVGICRKHQDIQFMSFMLCKVGQLPEGGTNTRLIHLNLTPTSNPATSTSSGKATLFPDPDP